MTNALLSPWIVIRGAGEMASAIAWRLYMANMRRIVMLDLANPLCVRRTVSFCVALTEGTASVEGVAARAVTNSKQMLSAWDASHIGVMLADDWKAISDADPDVVIDAILAKRNIATSINDAALVIALGPGFSAGEDCHLVIETNRGHHLGRIIESGSAASNTGIPGAIGGYTAERVLRAPVAGRFETDRDIGDSVMSGELIGTVAGRPVGAAIDGALRGIIRNGTEVPAGLKLGDIDPRGDIEHCHTISDKARAIAGAVLEAVMRKANRLSGDWPC
jgi:xanthine dehydrogenase accessory factor